MQIRRVWLLANLILVVAATVFSAIVGLWESTAVGLLSSALFLSLAVERGALPWPESLPTLPRTLPGGGWLWVGMLMAVFALSDLSSRRWSTVLTLGLLAAVSFAKAIEGDWQRRKRRD